MRNIQIQLLAAQKAICLSKAREVLCLGGIGSGKSHGIAPWILNKISLHPNGCIILLAANTFSQLINSTVETVTAKFDEWGIKYTKTLSGSKKHILIGKTTVLLYSLENYQIIRGLNLDYAAVDEMAYSKKEALDVIRGRLRGRNTKTHQLLMTTSPNGYNFLYDEFGNIGDNTTKQLIHAVTEDNVFLPEGYYETLYERYGGAENSPLFQQECLGKFVNLTAGSIYSHFKREINMAPCTLDKTKMCFVGVDFNIGNMSAVIVQYYNGVFKVCKEIRLTGTDSNTFDLGQTIIKELQGYNVQIIPDSTGMARKTCATKTDLQILRDLGLRILETHNPHIRSRQQTVNMAFLKKQCLIDPSCVVTIKELESLSVRDDEGTKTHLQVCLGYVIWKLAPLQEVHKQLQPRVIR